jgi:cytochrome c oxidase cbb3-type subunit III
MVVGFSMRGKLPRIAMAGTFFFLSIAAISQEMAPANGSFRTSGSQDRAAATRSFLGLGALPDKAAVARGEPIYQQNCSFCHGPKARGAVAPGLVTSDVVLADDHGEHLVPFLKTGRPEKGMPAFSQLSEQQRIDLAEFLHQQVQDIANRGAYHLPNIVVGDPAKGEAYVVDHCMSCHTAATFGHIASKFRSADQLQRDWIWPTRLADNSLAIIATVKTRQGTTISGRVTQVSDFRIALIAADGQSHVIERGPGVDLKTKDALATHQVLVNSLKNEDMHNVTAYLETLR